MIAGIIIAVLVIVGGGVAAAILLLGGDDDDSADGGDSGDSSGALETAQSFIAALEDGDCEAAGALATQSFVEQYGASCDSETLQQSSYGDPEITDESDDAATAEFSVASDQGDSTVAMDLVVEDGEWKVAGLGPSGGIPSASIPSFSVPTAPSFSVPSFSIPSFSIPSFTVPTS
ncbi:MAG TPA: hypothetical protein VEX15_01725 [Nocardioidaceae bacterium]|nr:hypothetical protein [Nocardioidaceae bacterium]